MNGRANRENNGSPARPVRVVLFVAALALAVGSPLWSQDGQQPEFVSELLSLLAQEGWTPEEVRALAAQDVAWEEAEGADPEVVALALELAKSEDAELEPMAQALMAVDLARAAMQMESLGIGELTIALTALEGVREILMDVQAFRSGELSGNLGESIRNRMQERVAGAARAQADKRIRDRVQEAQRNRPEGVVPDLSGIGDGLPGSGYSTWW